MINSTSVISSSGLIHTHFHVPHKTTFICLLTKSGYITKKNGWKLFTKKKHFYHAQPFKILKIKFGQDILVES